MGMVKMTLDFDFPLDVMDEGKLKKFLFRHLKQIFKIQKRKLILKKALKIKYI